jgi:tRNA-guanine family transglycosylase
LHAALHDVLALRARLIVTDVMPTGDSYVSLPSSSGTIRVSVTEWMDLAAAAAPDVVFMLSDEISSVSTGGSSRTRKSIDRSNQWFLQQLADLRSRPSLQHTAVFASVQGGNSLGNRARACASISAMKVDGVVLGGLNTGEERDERCGIITSMITALPSHLPRMLSCAGGPEDLLDAGVCKILCSSQP